MYFAAKNGYLEILKWAHDNGCTWNEILVMVQQKMVLRTLRTLTLKY